MAAGSSNSSDSAVAFASVNMMARTASTIVFFSVEFEAPAFVAAFRFKESTSKKQQLYRESGDRITSRYYSGKTSYRRNL